MADVNRFLEGVSIFQKQHFGKNSELATALTSGQKPQALLIGCCDSRVDPALLMTCAPGDLFVLRNIANLVPPFTKNDDYHGVSSSIEYAVCFLKVSDIIVLGHSQCGGINALMSSAKGELFGDFIGKWVSIAEPARDKVLDEYSQSSIEEQLCACEKESILVSLSNLAGFPWVAERVKLGTLELHGWYYDIRSGQLSGYNRAKDDFEVMVEGYGS
ncbi:MAG: carbonic anhydrase [Pelovirga sp.]